MPSGGEYRIDSRYRRRSAVGGNSHFMFTMQKDLTDWVNTQDVNIPVDIRVQLQSIKSYSK